MKKNKPEWLGKIFVYIFVIVTLIILAITFIICNSDKLDTYYTRQGEEILVDRNSELCYVVSNSRRSLVKLRRPNGIPILWDDVKDYVIASEDFVPIDTESESESTTSYYYATY